MSTYNSRAKPWGAVIVGEASRRQSTTPLNALDRLPNQRPVQVFNSPGLYGIPPDSWASLKEPAVQNRQEGFAATAAKCGCDPVTKPELGLLGWVWAWLGL